MSKTAWTDKELSILKDLVGKRTTKEIAAVLSRTTASITSKLAREGLSNNAKYTLESVNKRVGLLYPHLQFLNFEGVTKYATIQDSRCGHSWETTPERVYSRGIGIKCQVCNTTNIAKTNSSFFAEIQAKEGYSEISSISGYQTSKKLVYIKYICGHTDSTIASDLIGKGTKKVCRICTPQNTNRKPPEVFKQEFSLICNSASLLDEYTTDSTYLRVKGDCLHTWKINPHNFLQKQTLAKCPVCFPPVVSSNATSAGEKELLDWLKKVYSGWLIENDRFILRGLELDIVLPDLGLAIEYNGTYWHSDLHKDKNYHINKTNLVQQTIDYQLLHVFEHEWKFKQDIVKSRLLSKLNQTEKIYARKCTVRKIEFPSEFLDLTHMQGKGTATKLNYGLFLKDELVGVMTFGTPRFSNLCDYELIRMSFKLNTTIVGGASKLFKAFLTENENKSVLTYADRRYSNGKVYEALGFKLSHISSPGYFYSIKDSRKYDVISRYKAQKAKLKTLFPNHYKDNLTESEIMDKSGYLKIHDCGNLVYTYTV